jgi:hypothetical protein
MGSFRLKDCSLFINGKLVGKDDEVIQMANDLSYGVVPKQLRNFYLDEDELSELEILLTHEIFVRGNCLTPDEDFIVDEDEFI